MEMLTFEIADFLDLRQAHLCERENYDITTAACQHLEPRLAWTPMTGIMTELDSER
jgi:hypothetical protein